MTTKSTRSDTCNWLDLSLVNGRYSAALVEEIDALIEGRVTNVFAIFDEIASLEGAPHAKVSRTKTQGEFKGAWLKGLWHKHYFRSELSSMVSNISNYWKKPGRFERMFAAEFGGKTMSAEEFSKQFSYRLVLDGYKRRSDDADLTGEWIVYALQDGVRYYLRALPESVDSR